MKKMVLIIILFSVVFSSCSKVYIRAESKYPIKLTAEQERNYKIITRFSEKLKASYSLDGLVSLSNPDVEKLLNSLIKKYNGDAIINLEITTLYDYDDYLVTMGLGALGYFCGYLLTYSYQGAAILQSIFSMAYSTKSVLISGDIIKYE